MSVLTVKPKGEVFTQEEFEQFLEKFAEARGRAAAEDFREAMQPSVDSGVKMFKIGQIGEVTIH